MALEGDQVFTPSIKGRKAKAIPSCPCWDHVAQNGEKGFGAFDVLTIRLLVRLIS